MTASNSLEVRSDDSGRLHRAWINQNTGVALYSNCQRDCDAESNWTTPVEVASANFSWSRYTNEAAVFLEVTADGRPRIGYRFHGKANASG